MLTLKAENYILFSKLSEDLSPGDSSKKLSEEVRGKSGHLGVFARNAVVGTSKLHC